MFPDFFTFKFLNYFSSQYNLNFVFVQIYSPLTGQRIDAKKEKSA